MADMFTVVLRNTVGGLIHEATDHVPADQLDDYLTDARTRWPQVTVTPEEP